jgi:hypothetical protein
MKKNLANPILIIASILVLIVSAAWTYNSIHTNHIAVSYVVDVITLIMIILLIFSKNGKLKKSLDHDNYMDLITEGNIMSYNKLIVNISSLEDLVKLAVDLDKRVIHDAKLGKYFVLAEDMTYIHEPGLINPLLDKKQQLGKLLIERGVLQPEQLETGLFYQKRIGCKLGEALISLGFIDETILFSTLAAQQNIAYYELDTKKELADTSWIANMSINKARALQALPLGFRSDGTLVVACGETAKVGIAIALQEILGVGIYVVATRPSHIYEILEKLENREKLKRKFIDVDRDRKVEAYMRISDKEWEQFINKYYKGKIDTIIILKAMGLIDSALIAQVPENDSVINWLTNKNLINGQVMNLIKATNKLISEENGDSRKGKMVPDLLDLLEKAYYITSETADWAYNESEVQDKPVEQLLESNYLVALETIEYAVLVLNSLKSILNKTKIY